MLKIQNEKFKDLYSKIRNDLVNQIYNEGINIDNLAQTLNMDEDDLARLLQFKNSSCPYFSYGDEYRIARKQ